MSDSAAGAPVTATVEVDHHVFHLAEPDMAAAGLPLPDNGLISSLPGKAIICTGAAGGRGTVAVQARATRPGTVETGGWDEVLDHSLTAPAGMLRVRCPMGHPPDLPSLSPNGPGVYRVRVHARGRDIAPDGVAFEPLEDYLILTWTEDRGPRPPGRDPPADRPLRRRPACQYERVPGSAQSGLPRT